MPPHPLPITLLEGSPIPGVPPGVGVFQIHKEGDTALLRAAALPAAPGLQAKHNATSAPTALGWACLQQNDRMRTV